MVSVIIPLYNTEKYILETINSVVIQTYTDWELIVIDDGSTDSSASIVKDLMKSNDKIQYFYQENLGVSVARNNGLSKAKGNFIALLDADDVWEPENLTRKMVVLEKEASISWVYSNMYNADEFANIIEEAPKGKDTEILDSILLWKEEVIPGPCSNVIFDRKCYDDGVYFDATLSTAADQDFTIQLAANYNGFHIDNPLWRYRILEGSMSKNISVMERDHILVFKKAAKNGYFKNVLFKQQCFSNLYWILAGSWWKDGNNKVKGLYFIILALLVNPFSFTRFFKLDKK